jgi:ABC-type dipeptide/oligopeptide/nickel transport system permease subunit
MIYESFQYLDGHPLLLVFPAAALSITVIAFNVAGEFLSRVLDPRYAGRH